MEYEIEEPINPTPWQDEWRFASSGAPGQHVSPDDMCLKALEIPESDEP
jgi:hypothetical protein